MNARRILWGLDRPPRGVGWDHPRLPGITLGPAPLRLNSLPVPPALLAGGTKRATRAAAMLAWLEAGCGDYARSRRHFMGEYLRFVGQAIAGPALDERVARFAGLFAAEDWTWSALRPLPRAWLEAPTGPAMADILFWDGQRALAVLLGDGSAAALEAVDVTCLRLGPQLDMHEALPDWVREAWRSDPLPASPFRRAL